MNHYNVTPHKDMIKENKHNNIKCVGIGEGIINKEAFSSREISDFSTQDLNVIT